MSVNQLCARARAGIRDAGLETHEDEDGVEVAELLGLSILKEGLVSVKHDLRNRLYGAFGRALRRGRMTSKQPQVLLGHLTSQDLL